ncbi:MAG: septum formation initiator family protein [Myxococcota bacterium]|nr:septum formation initiator family protein [Myxococcota bacterium]
MRAYWLVAAVTALGIVLVLIDQKSGVAEWQRLRSELAVSQERIEELSARSEGLRSQIAELETEPFAVERAIREELGLVRPGERLIRFTGERSSR